MEIRPLMFPGCYLILAQPKLDERGIFVKTFVKDEYRTHGLYMDFVEEYYSLSHMGVIRGLHFQIPPFEYFKIVACLHGHIKDVIVDLRQKSPTCNQTEVIEIDARDGLQLYLPPGIAHGFLTQSADSVVLYHVSSLYSPSHDCGIRWNSIPVDWGVAEPILSARDKALPGLAEFVSPFVYPPA